MAKWKPEGMQSVTPSIAVEGCAEAIEVYKKVFGAVEKERLLDSSGKKVLHAILTIGDSNLFLNDHDPFNQKVTAMAGGANFYLYIEDVDQTFERAKAAGFKVTMPMADQFWGDRFGSVMDRWGNHWEIAQHIKDLTPEELRKAGEEFAKSMKR